MWVRQKFREEYAEKFKYKPHDSWVTKVDYVDDINSVVSTGHDNVLAMMDLETRKIKWRLDSSRVRFSSLSERAHTRGIRTWDFSSQFSVFCTGGVERTVLPHPESASLSVQSVTPRVCSLLRRESSCAISNLKPRCAFWHLSIFSTAL